MHRFRSSTGIDGPRRGNANGFHGPLEESTILGPLNRVDARANQLNTELVEHSFGRQFGRDIQGGLTAQGGQTGVRTFFSMIASITSAVMGSM